MALEKTPLYRFGPFTLDPTRRLIEREGEALPLTSRAFDTLLVLVENHGRVVTKKHLMETVWKGTFVEENNLNQSISTLRHALGDGEDGNRFVATVTRRGYSFVAPVAESIALGEPSPESTRAPTLLHPPTPEPTVPRSRGLRRSGVALVVALVTACAIAVGTFWLKRPARPTGSITGVHSIAVLPFKPLVTPKQEDYLGLALADAVITRLGYLHSLSVRPTAAIRSFSGPSQDPIAAGRALNVDAVLDGQIQQSRGRIRITVQLIGVREAAPLWSDRFDTSQTDLFRMEDSIAEGVSKALTSELPAREEPRRATTSRAYEAYLRGRYYWNKRTPDSFRKGLELFQQSIEADPSFGAAWAGLADSYNFIGDAPKAKEAARRALELDPGLAEAHAALGNAALLYDFRFGDAERELGRALELNPSYATAHQWLAYALVSVRRFDEAVSEIRKARELDPLSLSITTDVGDILYYARRYEEAERECRKAIEMDPHFVQAHAVLGEILSEKGELDAAMRELSLIDDEAGLARVHALAGRREEARKLLAGLPEAHPSIAGLWPSRRARVLAALGEKGRAFECLEKAYQSRYATLALLAVDPQFDTLRSDPRFADLLRRIGNQPPPTSAD